MEPLEKMQQLTIAAIARTLGASLSGAGGAAPSGYSIDSRTLARGELFFAIVGPTHDGHAFAADAAGKGACGLVVSDPMRLPAELREGRPAPVLVVPDTLRGLQDLAAAVRRSLSVKVVGITGSGGKTTTKEMTRQVLEGTFRVHASRGNLNNLYGCPLSLLQLGPQHQVAVLEMGMSYPGELSRLAEIADPDIGVLTNVSGVHLAHFRSVDEVAAAKAELFAGMRENSIGIFNNDDERCRRVLGAFKGYAFTFGIERPSDLMASEYRMLDLEGSSFEVRHAHNGGSRRVEVRTRFAGTHHVYNALAAMSAGYMMGIDLGAMAQRLETLEPLGMRGRVLRLRDGVRVLDDSYNSNPAAMRHALGVLAGSHPSVEGGRRAIAFGDMLELGEHEAEEHRQIGREMAGSGAALVIGVGELSRLALEQVTGTETRHFEDSAAAAAWAADNARAGDVWLVKGSRGTALEKVVAALRERFGEE